MGHKYELYVNVTVRDEYLGGAGLTVIENAKISCETFLEVAKILGQFYKVTQIIKLYIERGGQEDVRQL